MTKIKHLPRLYNEFRDVAEVHGLREPALRGAYKLLQRHAGGAEDEPRREDKGKKPRF